MPRTSRVDARGCPAFTLHSPQGDEHVQLNLLGNHNVANALAAAAAAYALGVSLFGIATGLGAVQPVKGRTVAQLASNGMRVIDDTYNANQSSICAAIDLLKGFDGRKVLVLGDIAELGDWAEQSHREVGAYASRQGRRALRRRPEHGPRRRRVWFGRAVTSPARPS
jgi:UDP-N-acetylmuramoyl-tripeptide--D-alanyl-D-alanine ligase